MPLPPTACCRKCYYPLTGAAPGRCPECGREYDPSDPKSYLAKPPSKWKWPRRIAAVLLVLGLGYAFRPTGYVKAVARFIESDGSGIVHTRYTLLPPQWLGDVPYPYWTFREHHSDQRAACAADPLEVTAANYLSQHVPGVRERYVGVAAEFHEWDGSGQRTIGQCHTTAPDAWLDHDGTIWQPSIADEVLGSVSRREAWRNWGRSAGGQPIPIR